MANPTQEEVAQRIAASEARTETKIEVLRGEINQMRTSLEGRLDRLGDAMTATRADTRFSMWAIIGTVVAVGIGVAGLLYALSEYGNSSFERGLAVDEALRAELQQFIQQQGNPR